MDICLHCCEKCQIYWTCDTKWYRGERGEENVCCERCAFYTICLEKSKHQAEQKKPQK